MVSVPVLFLEHRQEAILNTKFARVCVFGDMLSESSRQNSVQNTKDCLPCSALCNRQPAHPWHPRLLVSGASAPTRTWSVASIASETSNRIE